MVINIWVLHHEIVCSGECVGLLDRTRRLSQAMANHRGVTDYLHIGQCGFADQTAQIHAEKLRRTHEFTVTLAIGLI